eukprot:g3214.t1
MMMNEKPESDVEMEFLDMLMKEEGGGGAEEAAVVARGRGGTSPSILAESFGDIEPLPFDDDDENNEEDISYFGVRDEDTKGSCEDETKKGRSAMENVESTVAAAAASRNSSHSIADSSVVTDEAPSPSISSLSTSTASRLGGTKRSRSKSTTSDEDSSDHGAETQSPGEAASSSSLKKKKKKGRKCQKPLSREEKKRLRLIRNRRSAQLHRERKKAFIEGLESKVKQLTVANESLERKVAKLLEENKRLRQGLGVPYECPKCAPYATHSRSVSSGVANVATGDILPDIMSDTLFDNLDEDLRGVSTSGAFVHVGDEDGGGFTSDSSANTTTPPPSPGPKGFLMLFAFACSFMFFGGSLMPSSSFEFASSTKRFLLPSHSGVATSSSSSSPPSVFDVPNPTHPHGRPTGRVLMGIEENDENESARFFQSIAERQIEKLASSSSLVDEANRRAADDKAIALWRGSEETRSSETIAIIHEKERGDRDAILSAVELLRSKGIPMLLDVSSSSSETLKISLDDEWATNQRTRAVIDSFVEAFTSRNGGNHEGYAAVDSKTGEGRNSSLILCPQAHGIIASPELFSNGVSRASSTSQSAATSRALRFRDSSSPHLRQGRIAGSANASVDGEEDGNHELMLVVPSNTLHWGKWGNVRQSDKTELYEIRCRMDSVKPLTVSA